MVAIFAAILETGRLARVVGYSLLAGVGISIIFSLGVSSAAGLFDALRSRRSGTAAVWGTLATVCVLVTVGVAVLGIVTMTQK